MRLFPFAFRASVAALGLSLCLAAASAQTAPAPEARLEVPEALLARYLAAKTLAAEYRTVFRGENGVAFVGRINAPPNLKIASRTVIHKDGSFATALYPGRRLIFYAHGHQPLVVDEGTEILPWVADAGDLVFTPTPPEKLRRATGRVSLAPLPSMPETADTATVPEIRVVLGITNHAYLYSDHGHRGGNLSVTVQSAKLRPGDTFDFGGLSAIPYDLKLSSPGYIVRRITLDPEAEGTLSLDTITLEPAPVLTFRYIAQLNFEDAAWSAAAPGYKTIVCDGDNRFDFTEARDKLRNRLYLRLKPTDEGVEADFWAYPSEFHDLGQGRLADFAANHEWVANLEEQKTPSKRILERGRVYFFRNQDRGTNCLFSVE